MCGKVAELIHLSLRETGISSVIVDKNWKHVTRITDRNIILVKGEVVFEGSAAGTADAIPGCLTASSKITGQYAGSLAGRFFVPYTPVAFTRTISQCSAEMKDKSSPDMFH